MSVNTFSKRTEIDLRSIQLRSILVWTAPYGSAMDPLFPCKMKYLPPIRLLSVTLIARGGGRESQNNACSQNNNLAQLEIVNVCYLLFYIVYSRFNTAYAESYFLLYVFVFVCFRVPKLVEFFRSPYRYSVSFPVTPFARGALVSIY